MIRPARFGVFGVLFSALWAQWVNANEFSGARISRDMAQQRIPTLNLKSESYKIQSRETPQEELLYYVEIQGSLFSQDWALVLDNQRVAVTEDGGFTARYLLRAEKAPLIWTAIGPQGELQREEMEIHVPNWMYLPKSAAGRPRLTISPGLGISKINYTETNILSGRTSAIVYSSIALSGKLSLSYPLSKNLWDISFSGYGTLMSMTRNLTQDVRFLGANIRAGWTTRWLRRPWSLQISGGWYYTTMIVSGSPFGFKNMQGPQLFPVLRRQIDRNQAVSAYFKFSPVSGKFRFLDLNNREMAFGAAYSFLLSKNKVLSFTADIARLQLELVDTRDGSLNVFDSSSLSLGASYSF